MTYFGNSNKNDEAGVRLKRKKREEALLVLKEGLQDPDTHVIYRNALEKRKKRLEKLLGIECENDEEEHAELREACQRTFKGERIISEKTKELAEKKAKEGEEVDVSNIGKSVWRMCDGGEGSVEELALEGYKKKGWKGFHSENGILTTVFAMLFFDIIFEDIEGVFETSFQSAPLDLATDAFCITRAESISKRLAEIGRGEAAVILEEVDDREREKKTCCVGLHWDRYAKQDLLEVVQCLGPKALVCICKVFAEEWGHRASGMPDLCLWKPEKGKLKFAEVKGPGDRLSDTQRIWIDLLIGAGVEVELCKVVEFDQEDEAKSVSKAKKARKRARKQEEQEEELEPVVIVLD
ncbi:hypothetical protein BT69DRAFT_1221552 [Atractiella rhizophila]|nr:hypothetical protein BT69DRAFT_1221552 [Atractiella rhizophila]